MSLNRYLKVQNRSNLEGDLKFENKKKVTWGIISMLEYLKHSDTKSGTFEQTHRDTNIPKYMQKSIMRGIQE